MQKQKATLIKTFDGDIYIIRGMTPAEVSAMCDGVDEVKMPNGAFINPKAISSKQDYHDYEFQTEQKRRHRDGQYLRGGEWHYKGKSLGVNAHLERITGELNEKLPEGKKLKLPE